MWHSDLHIFTSNTSAVLPQWGYVLGTEFLADSLHQWGACIVQAVLTQCVHSTWIITSNECSGFFSFDVSLSVETKERVRWIMSMSEGEVSSLQDTEGKRKQDEHSKSLRIFSSNREGKKKDRMEQESGILTMEAAEGNREISSVCHSIKCLWTSSDQDYMPRMFF